jgi:LemA protein
MASWVVLGLLLVVGFMLMRLSNRLVQLRVRADSAWSDIDLQLERRHELIPQLVESVEGYASQERSTFANIAKYRSQAIQATTPADRAQAENRLMSALKHLLAIAESYPDLKANQQFLELKASLNQTEDAIENARRYYNGVVRDLNTKIRSFPSNMVAGTFGFHERQFFEAAAADREPVAVKS